MTKVRTALALAVITLLVPLGAAAPTARPIYEDDWSAGLGSWRTTGLMSATRFCDDAVQGCYVRIDPLCCGGHGIFDRSLEVSTTGYLDVQWRFRGSSLTGNADAMLRTYFPGGGYVELQWTSTPDNRGLAIHSSADMSERVFAAWMTTNTWYQARIRLDFEQDTATAYLLSNTGAVIATSPTITIDAGAEGLSHLSVMAAQWTSFATNTWDIDDIFVDSDLDRDGIVGSLDNCSDAINPGQGNSDGDVDGDACDADDDNDGILDAADNCVTQANPDQLNFDGDALGDACDADADGDGVVDAIDNCLFFKATDQTDSDGDGAGDPCDPDDDNDGIYDTVDNCARVPNTGQENNDGDSQGDVCDADDDNDGVPDATDNCKLIANSDQLNHDTDPWGDVCDSDDDDDGLSDIDEARYATDPLDADTDDDGLGDGIEVKTYKTDPLDPDTDGDLFGDDTEVRGKSDPLNWTSVPLFVIRSSGHASFAGSEGPLDEQDPVL